MLRHEFGQNLVLGMDLFLQVCNPLLVSGMVGWPLLLEGSSPVLEEFLLPAVEDRWLECVLSFTLLGERLLHFQLNRNRRSIG